MHVVRKDLKSEWERDGAHSHLIRVEYLLLILCATQTKIIQMSQPPKIYTLLNFPSEDSGGA